jgi:hypothetical protein
MTEEQRLDMIERHKRTGVLTLADVRLLVEPLGTMDSWKNNPVYICVAGRYYPVTDVSFVAGPRESRTEIQAGAEVRL